MSTPTTHMTNMNNLHHTNTDKMHSTSNVHAGPNAMQQQLRAQTRAHAHPYSHITENTSPNHSNHAAVSNNRKLQNLQHDVENLRSTVEYLTKTKEAQRQELLFAQTSVATLLSEVLRHCQHLYAAMTTIDSLLQEKAEMREDLEAAKKVIHQLEHSEPVLAKHQQQKIFSQLHAKIGEAADARYELMLMRRRKELDDAEKLQLVQPRIAKDITAMTRAELEARLQASYRKTRELEQTNDDLRDETMEQSYRMFQRKPPVDDDFLLDAMRFNYPDPTWGRKPKLCQIPEHIEAINKRHRAMRDAIIAKLKREKDAIGLSHFTCKCTPSNKHLVTSHEHIQKGFETTPTCLANKRHHDEDTSSLTNSPNPEEPDQGRIHTDHPLSKKVSLARRMNQPEPQEDTDAGSMSSTTAASDSAIYTASTSTNSDKTTATPAPSTAERATEQGQGASVMATLRGAFTFRISESWPRFRRA